MWRIARRAGPAKTLLEFMVSIHLNRVIRATLGNSIVAKASRLASIAEGIITGCSEEFGGCVSSQDTLRAQFCASEGETFKIQPSFVTGITVDNGGFLSDLENRSEGEIHLYFNTPVLK